MKGGGKPLKDGAPFVSITVSVLESGGSVDGIKSPNILCKQCHSIFKKDIGVRGHCSSDRSAEVIWLSPLRSLSLSALQPEDYDLP
jgi:hypothetical protein